ncbi:class I SAM-dependent methyltransferase [Streptosporangium sp. DT93]|uniref:class I SAM-dependent methyltransferase n=1 Tax=Streptosporangium sp. DT93 TaxID=3393428 RepID=UPI003CF5EF68
MTRQERSSPEETGGTHDRLAGSHDEAPGAPGEPGMWAGTSGLWADTTDTTDTIDMTDTADSDDDASDVWADTAGSRDDASDVWADTAGSRDDASDVWAGTAGSREDASGVWSGAAGFPADTSGAHDSVSGFWADTSGSRAGASGSPAGVPEGRADAFGGNLHAGYWTDEYDEASAGEATDRLTDLVAERLEVLPGDHVLDVGSGTGRPAVRIATARDVHVAGVTLSEYQVRLARSRPEAGEGVGQADFRLADAMWLPFEDDSFDAAYAIEALAHLENPSAALDEIARVLRPGGRFVVGEWYLLEPLPGEETERFAHDFDVRFLPTADDLYRRMDQAGLKIEIFHDIWANISRSFDQVDDVLPARATGPAGEASERPTARREMYRRFGQIPQISYALFTAVRH